MSLLRRRGAADPSGSTPFGHLVVGLGNPGKEYAGTRHNVGEQTVSLLAQRHGSTMKGGRDNSLVAEARFSPPGVEGPRAVLAFPLTYMNDSGRAVQALARRYRITDPARIIVVHDELDLEPTIVRVKVGGGLAGHNGLRSIAQHLGTNDFVRVRIGVGKPPSKEAGAGHVLSKLPSRQRELFDVAVQEAADAVEVIVADSPDAAMRRFNGKRPAD